MDLAQEAPQRPRLIQGSPAPLAIGNGGTRLICAGCENLLVEGYDPRLLIAVDIECHRCSSVTRTEQWPDLEPLPNALVTLGQRGRFLIEQTLNLSTAKSSMTCDQEIARIQAISGIRPAAAVGIALTLEGIADLEARVSHLCRGLDECIRRTRNAFARGNRRFLNHPPAWALVQLRAMVESGRRALSTDDLVAMNYLHVSLSVLSRWQHHERFRDIQAALLFEFPHAITQMIIASYLADVGTPIGFNEPLRGGGRSPDMYLNFDARVRHAIEVKAPEQLQWPHASPTAGRLERILEDKFRATRGQINGGDGGALVIGASVADRVFGDVLLKVLGELAAAGEIPSRISAVTTVWLNPYSSIEPAAGGLSLGGQAAVKTVLNPRYTGPVAIRIGED